MELADQFDVFDVRILPAKGGGIYLVEARFSSGAQYRPRSLELNLAALVEVDSDLEAYGRKLGKALFGFALKDVYEEVLSTIQYRGGKVRLRLHIVPEELQALHWERIYHPLYGDWQPLATDDTVIFSRYIPSSRWDSRQPASSPLRLLLVVASPSDLPTIMAPGEIEALLEACRRLPDVDIITLDSGTSNGPTLDRLRRELASGYDIVHFVGHASSSHGSSIIFIEDEDGQRMPIHTKELIQIARSLSYSPALFLLGLADMQGRPSHEIQPMEYALAEHGKLEAVLVQREPLALSSHRAFSQEFYEQLSRHGRADLATSQARAALLEQDADWSAPTLLLRDEDGIVLSETLLQKTDTGRWPKVDIRQTVIGTVTDDAQVIGGKVVSVGAAYSEPAPDASQANIDAMKERLAQLESELENVKSQLDDYDVEDAFRLLDRVRKQLHETRPNSRRIRKYLMNMSDILRSTDRAQELRQIIDETIQLSDGFFGM